MARFVNVTVFIVQHGVSAKVTRFRNWLLDDEEHPLPGRSARAHILSSVDVRYMSPVQ